MNPNIKNRSCGTCIYIYGVGLNMCRRYPPNVDVRSGSYDTTNSTFPTVHDTDCCGEWVENETETETKP